MTEKNNGERAVVQKLKHDHQLQSMSSGWCRAAAAAAASLTLAICMRDMVPSCIRAPPDRHCTTTGRRCSSPYSKALVIFSPSACPREPPDDDRICPQQFLVSTHFPHQQFEKRSSEREKAHKASHRYRYTRHHRRGDTDGLLTWVDAKNKSCCDGVMSYCCRWTAV